MISNSEVCFWIKYLMLFTCVFALSFLLENAIMHSLFKIIGNDVWRAFALMNVLLIEEQNKYKRTNNHICRARFDASLSSFMTLMCDRPHFNVFVERLHANLYFVKIQYKKHSRIQQACNWQHAMRVAGLWVIRDILSVNKTCDIIC